MNAYRVIDVPSWPRRELFEFYQKFANPCFNVTVPVEGQALYDHSRREGESFFLLALYAILRAANSVPQVRQRIVDGKVLEFEKVAAMTPIMTEQEMFRQVWCEYEPTFAAFAAKAKPLVAAAKKAAPAPLLGRGEDFICASCQPWLHFTSVTQPNYVFGQSTPILAWGKLHKGIVPMGCVFHHALVDGLHVGRFFASIEASFAQPESLYGEAAALPF